MSINVFKLEKYLAEYEFSAPYLLCSSDAETFSMQEISFIHYQSKEPVAKFSERLIREEGVLLMPAPIYDLNTNHFRIGFGRKNMPEALEKLKQFLTS